MATKKQLEDQLARALADYDNFKKRVERQREQQDQMAAAKVVSSLLPAFDMFFRAQEHLGDSGLAIALDELRATLAQLGIVEVAAKAGENFDEELHEAVELVDDGRQGGKGKIEQVVLTGWRFKDGLVIRYAKVRVK